MPNPRLFPNSARAAWLNRQARSSHRPRIVPSEVREHRLMTKELSRDLREATLEQLLEVARILGRTPKWLEMVKLEARRPGLVGRACLRAIR